MKKVGIVVAMLKEWDALFAGNGRARGRAYTNGETNNGTPYVAMVSGIGKVNAAVAAFKMYMQDCTDILSFGCAGGADYTVKVGDVIVGDEFIYHDVWCGAPNQHGQVQGLPETFPSNNRKWLFLKGYRHGLIASGDTFIEKDYMAQGIVQMFHPDHFPLALDMESAAIAQVCHQHNVGFTSVRVISDNPLSGEHAAQYEWFWQRKDETLAGLFKRFMEQE